ncbi:MAG: cob(I)yrinic acid a,c-diamide adenosyltransferase, partial [Pseudobutyrivibrio sp.]|nr:cob(I)yrinic acid a,c-diamide adenosyltransferase [Pseudobutyrivibrio sp.]
TGECDLLVLDEVLGVLDEGIVAEDAITDALEGKSLATNVIITGQNMSEGLFKIADNVLKIESEK